MKPIVFFALLLFTINLNAQKNTFKISYSPIQLLKMDKEWIHSHNYENSNYSGAFTIDYHRFFNQNLHIGVSVTYETASYDGTLSGQYQPPYPDHNKTYSYSYVLSQEIRYFYIGPQVGYYYINKDNFRLGSGISIVLLHNTSIDTLEFHKNKTSKINFFGHVELISFTLGKTHGLTGQLGFGHKGLFSLGYFYSF